MKKIICWLFGHLAWKPYNGDPADLYCERCGKHTTLEELLQDIRRN